MPFNDNDAIFTESNLDRYARPQKKRRLFGMGNPNETEDREISPEMLALLGAGVDSVGTYKMLKSGTGIEGNPMYSGLNNDPLKTSLAIAGTSLSMGGLRHLIRKKFPRIADSLAANQGSRQIALGVSNFGRDKYTKGSADDEYNSILSNYRRQK